MDIVTISEVEFSDNPQESTKNSVAKQLCNYGIWEDGGMNQQKQEDLLESSWILDKDGPTFEKIKSCSDETSNFESSEMYDSFYSGSSLGFYSEQFDEFNDSGDVDMENNNFCGTPNGKT